MNVAVRWTGASGDNEISGSKLFVFDNDSVIVYEISVIFNESDIGSLKGLFIKIRDNGNGVILMGDDGGKIVMKTVAVDFGVADEFGEGVGKI